MDLIGALPDVPVAALATIATEVRKYGADVVFWTPTTGYCESISGRVRFSHDGSILYVWLEIDMGHFPYLMIVGGCRQIVMEGVEVFHKSRRRTAGARA